MQLSSNFYELHCYVSNSIYNNQFLANFEMSQSLAFLMNMSIREKFLFVIVENIPQLLCMMAFVYYLHDPQFSFYPLLQKITLMTEVWHQCHFLELF